MKASPLVDQSFLGPMESRIRVTVKNCIGLSAAQALVCQENEFK